MALYGNSKDISFFHTINSELLHNIIDQEVGYYQISSEATPTNIYGEAVNGTKVYLSPVLLVCLIYRGNYEADYSEIGPSIYRDFSFLFLKKDLIEANVVPQIGDIILWNNDQYEVDLVNENQQIVGKDPEYNYNGNLADFGESFSIICKTHYASPERLGLIQTRL